MEKIIETKNEIEGKKRHVTIYDDTDTFGTGETRGYLVNWVALGSVSPKVARDYAETILEAVRVAEEMEREL